MGDVIVSGKDFLTKRSDRTLRREIDNICDSYSHPWDILAELTQNSVDAIRKWNRIYDKKEHMIEILIDQKTRNLSIRDTGVGIDPKLLPNLFAPNETDKDGDEESVGEKGVGLKFAIFSSNKFLVETESPYGRYSCEINNARMWRANKEYEGLPVVENEETGGKSIGEKDSYTKITLLDVALLDDGERENIFDYSIERLDYLLRTKTAIGYTAKKFQKGDLSINVVLTLVDKNGKKMKRNIPFRYAFPDEFFETHNLVEMDTFLKRAAAMDPNQKRKALAGKCMFSMGKDLEKDIRYYAFFVPSRETWVDIARKNGLFELQDGSSESDQQIIPDMGGGIYVSTKGMPTGAKLVPPASGVMGYWENLFVLLEYDSFRFDLGRKTIPGRTQGILKAVAKKQFNLFSHWKQVVSKDKKSPNVRNEFIHNFHKEEQIKKFESAAPLNFGRINFLKHPNGQEAAVVAIFHELIGAGVLVGYYGLSSGYKHNYDFWGHYKIDKSNLGERIRNNSEVPSKIDCPVVVEFKYNAASIIPDVQSNTKDFQDIDLLVCWDIDEREFAKFGVSIEPLREDETFWHGSNFVMEWPGTYNLGQSSQKPILCLKRFIEHKKLDGL